LTATGPSTVLATASSAIPISRILPDPADQARAMVAHPANPPAVLRVIELVPGPGTAATAVDRAESLFVDAGFDPVTLGHEIEGFVMNRLQGAVLREAYRLVDEGVADVAGIEAVMRLSLGPRWALSGPFETAELNTPGGIRAHAARMGPAYRKMGESRGERNCDWPPELVARVEAERRAIIPAADLPARALWRARAVARLVALRDRLMDEDKDAL
jgi:L-gulonate 3-dehydrogenase